MGKTSFSMTQWSSGTCQLDCGFSYVGNSNPTLTWQCGRSCMCHVCIGINPGRVEGLHFLILGWAGELWGSPWHIIIFHNAQQYEWD